MVSSTSLFSEKVSFVLSVVDSDELSRLMKGTENPTSAFSGRTGPPWLYTRCPRCSDAIDGLFVFDPLTV